jgi:hypothetical protein
MSSQPASQPSASQHTASQPSRNNRPLDIPLPIVNFSRAIYVVALVTALALQQPIITSVLLLIVTLGVAGGARWNVLGRLGRIIFGKRIAANPAVPLEDARLIRFNNLIVIGLLVAAQIAFWVTRTPLVGWVFVGMIIAASVAALAGYCVGCVLYYQFKLHKYKFLGES